MLTYLHFFSLVVLLENYDRWGMFSFNFENPLWAEYCVENYLETYFGIFIEFPKQNPLLKSFLRDRASTQLSFNGKISKIPQNKKTSQNSFFFFGDVSPSS